MSAALRIVSISHAQLKEDLRASLKSRKIKLENANIRTFQTYDLDSRTVLYAQCKGEEPVCIVSCTLTGVLFGNQKLRELPMTISCIRAAAKSIIPILGCGAFDGIAVTYCNEDFALVVKASKLLERLR